MREGGLLFIDEILLDFEDVQIGRAHLCHAIESNDGDGSLRVLVCMLDEQLAKFLQDATFHFLDASRVTKGHLAQLVVIGKNQMNVFVSTRTIDPDYSKLSQLR